MKITNKYSIITKLFNYVVNELSSIKSIPEKSKTKTMKIGPLISE